MISSEGSCQPKLNGTPQARDGYDYSSITHQISLRVPNLQAVPVDYVMIRTQGFRGFERQFERLKRLHGMPVVSRDASRSA